MLRQVEHNLLQRVAVPEDSIERVGESYLSRLGELKEVLHAEKGGGVSPNGPLPLELPVSSSTIEVGKGDAADALIDAASFEGKEGKEAKEGGAKGGKGGGKKSRKGGEKVKGKDKGGVNKRKGKEDGRDGEEQQQSKKKKKKKKKGDDS
jgi:hypothetical protein